MKSKNKKYLIISWHFPPYKSSSAFNLFKRLKDTGFEYDVIQVKLQEKPDNEGMFHYSNSIFNRYEVLIPSEDSRNIDARNIYISNVLSWYETLSKINSYESVISHSHEIVSHLAVLELKKQYPSINWVASFGDPIGANPFNHSYKFPLMEEDSLAETNVLLQADRIVVTNSYQQKIMLNNQHVRIDTDKFNILPHCFDLEMYKKSISNQQISDGLNIFRFMHVGMLYKYKRTSEPFILGVQRLIEKHPELKGRFVVEFYGANDKYIQAASDYGLEDIVVFKGVVTYQDSLALMCQADCLLLRDADFTDQGLEETPFYPGKLADYLGAAKPIIAVTMSKGCVPDMLAKIGGASLTENDIDKIAETMFSAIEGRLNIDFEEAKNYSSVKVAVQARKILEFSSSRKKVLIAGHDLKFAKYFIDYLESQDDVEILIDNWNGHDSHDEDNSRVLLMQADYIFCEWGLGNAVWYSNNKLPGQRLIVRMHLQEISTMHPKNFNHSNVDAYIMVSPYWFEKFIHQFSLDRRKCKMIYNLVDTENLNQPKFKDSRFNLGLIGDVPERKRLDLAIDIFSGLYQKDKRYKLFIKGKRPESYSWMHSPARKKELEYYATQYKRISDNGWSDSVVFEGHGPIDSWLKKIGWILSPSDFESFHLAPAEGMASGSCPLILSWPGAEFIYPKQLIHENVNSCIDFVFKNDGPSPSFLTHYAMENFSKDKNSKKIADILFDY